MFTDRLYTGQRQIAELGVYHFNARFYSPKLGRFLSADTLMSGFANPQNLNRFSYTANNPVRYTDPTGRCWIELSSHMVWFSDSDPKCGGAPAPTYTPTNTPSDDSDSDAPGDASNSTIRIGFGDYDETGAPVGGWGLGTVAGNNYTIITAEHVYVPGPYMWYQLGDHGQYTYQIDASTVNFDTSQPGDILVITLPQGLPNSFVPAQVGQNTFFGGEDVTVAYEDASDKLHVLDTEVQAFPFLVSPLDNTLIVPVDNPNWILDKGDSGGGVFYNGYLVGVNSIIDSQFNSPYMAFQPLK